MSEMQSEIQMGDYNRGGYIAFMLSMAVTMLFFVYIAFLHPGVDLKELDVENKEAAVGVTKQAPQAEVQKAQ